MTNDNIDYNKDYYKVLSVEKTASEDEIHKQFLKLSKKYHPDMQSGKSDAEKKECEEKFKEVNEANEILGNKENRERYDQIREMGGRRGGIGGFGFSGFGGADDMMNEFMRSHGFGMGGMGGMDGFGGRGFSNAHFRQQNRPRNPIDGQNIQINVNLPFEDFFFGCTKTLDVKVNNKCTHCTNGLVGNKPEYGTCPKCHGEGMLTTRRGNMIMQETCPNCGGSGQILKNKCKHCNGTTIDGVRTQSCTFEIPKFSYSGFKKTYERVGHCGVFGGIAGNITVIAHMDDNGRFILNSDYDNETLRTVHVVPILKAIIGGTEKILTPYGYTEVEIPRCFENPTEMRIKGKGLKHQNSNDNADLVVELQWDIPKTVTEKEREQLQKVLKSMGGRDGVYESIKKLHKYDDEYMNRVKESFGKGFTA